MLQVEVLGSDSHITIIEIETVLDAPKTGASITCGKCGKKVTVKRVGSPTRVPEKGPKPDENQTSLLK